MPGPGVCCVEGRAGRGLHPTSPSASPSPNWPSMGDLLGGRATLCTLRAEKCRGSRSTHGDSGSPAVPAVSTPAAGTPVLMGHPAIAARRTQLCRAPCTRPPWRGDQFGFVPVETSLLTPVGFGSGPGGWAEPAIQLTSAVPGVAATRQPSQLVPW